MQFPIVFGESGDCLLWNFGGKQRLFEDPPCARNLSCEVTRRLSETEAGRGLRADSG
jgi:hypothetical protein